MSQRAIGFIGLGRMGSAIAGRLAQHAGNICVFDAAKPAVEDFLTAHPGTATAGTVDETFARSSVIFLSLPGSPEVEAVIDAVSKNNLNGRTVVDLSTSRPASTRKLAAILAEQGAVFLDAPLTGGPKQALNGELTVIAAGDREAYDAVLPLLQLFGKRIFYAGGSGNGHTIKLINNCLSGIYACLYAELLPLVARTGLDPDQVFDIISASGGNSPVFQVYAPKMLKRDFKCQFTTALLEKDFSYLDDILEEHGLSGGLLKAARSLCERARARGLQNEDVSALIKLADAD